jgi:hypothetical protein
MKVLLKFQKIQFKQTLKNNLKISNNIFMFEKIEFKLLMENYMTKDEYRQLIQMYVDKYSISYANAKQHIIYKQMLKY